MTTRRNFIRTLGALPPALTLGTGWASSDPSRQALVIGNSSYLDAPLANPVNDARAVAGLLGQAGFTVASHLDARRTDMMAAIERFTAEVRKSDTKLVMFYFAGHGAQLDWRNYLLPVDAKAESADQLRQSCIDLNYLIGEFGKSKGKTFIIMLDACRNNPFGSSYRPEQKGLSQFDAPVGSLLAYATSPGNVASDGSGQNGLYTENLLRELSVRGTKIEDALKRVRLNVRLASNGAQIPWETTSLENDVFIFDGGKSKLSEAEQEKLIEEDMAEWGRIKSSGKIDDYAGYLRKFPNGRFAEIVQARLARLLVEVEKSRPQASAAPANADNRPTIKLGPGLPVPVFMEPTLNPYSAGRYPLGRNFTVGDIYKLRQSDTLTGVEARMLTAQVTKVDRGADRVEMDNGAIVTDLMGNAVKFGPVEYDAPIQNYPAELQIGKKWPSVGRVTIKGKTSDFNFDYQITRRETITVPAGTFDTFVIEARGWNRTYGSSLSHTLWVVPGLNVAVKREYIARNNRGNYVTTDRFELVELSQGSVDASCAAPLGGTAQRNLVIKSNCAS
ncbi:MAG: caspase family protein [Burkholderiales bacterium]|nr:caspase family protein [Burkholderiales bacterium]